MAIRCYIPTTLTALQAGLHAVHAVAPDAQGRALRGEELETAEFTALCIAAALAATAAFDADAAKTAENPAAEVAGPSPRVVVAYDAPESCAAEPLMSGFDLLWLETVDMSAVASFHLDEEAVWDQAVRLADDDDDATAAEGLLGDSDLLWYDATELPELLRTRI